MTHEPKYKIGDSIWYMRNNEVIETNIYGIKTDNGKYNYLYMVFVPSVKVGVQQEELWMYDFRIFKTKKELIEKL